jgi:hypothetical protein
LDCHLTLSHGSVLRAAIRSAFDLSLFRSVSLKSDQAFFSFSSQRLALFAFGLVFTFALGIDVRSVFAQGFRVENKSAPSVVGGDTFVSLEGRFTIALPQTQHGFRPLSIETPVGRATGDAYTWTMKEGSFSAGYVDASQPLDDKRVFANLREGMVAWGASKKGKLIEDRQIDFEKHQALELRFEFPDASTRQRFYVNSRRLYQVTLVLKPEQRAYEALAVKVLDSFKILSDAEVSAALKAKAADAEPSPLPQEPTVPRVRSDADDEGLHGSVKTVFQEDEDLSGTWSVQGRKPSSMEYYNERGNLTKRESYDYKGNLSDITVYGYLDGARVSRRKSIEHEYNPPPMMMAWPPGEARPKSDQRYSNKFTFQYDDQKRLIEKSWFLNNGRLSIRDVYKYSGSPANQREDLVYTADGSLNQRYLSILDDKGNEVERTSFERRDGSVRGKSSYAYEFDAKGNWIKRTTSMWITEPSCITRREPRFTLLHLCPTSSALSLGGGSRNINLLYCFSPKT